MGQHLQDPRTGRLAGSTGDGKDRTPTSREQVPSGVTNPYADTAAGAGQTGLFTVYDPTRRVAGSQVENTRLSQLGYDPGQLITIYRGVPVEADQAIRAGDWVTPNRQLAQDYAGTGNVVTLVVPAHALMTDPDDDSFEEMVYAPE
jgi:hypothetical protein